MKLFSWVAGLFGRETYDPFWREADEQYLRKVDNDVSDEWAAEDYPQRFDSKTR